MGLIVLRCFVFFVKVIIIIFVFMWVGWSLPRFRFDQLMMLAWRALIPIALAMLTMTALVIWYFGPEGYGPIGVSGRMALSLLLGNALVLALTMVVSRLI